MAKEELKSDEIYTISNRNDINNTKIRNGKMDIKTYVQAVDGLINGAKVVTINSESTEIEDIKKTISDCGLEGVENINYLQAIKRVIGMSDKALANE